MERRVLLCLVAFAAACTRHPRDVGNQKLNPRSEFEPSEGGGTGPRRALDAGALEGGAQPAAKGRVIAHASARAITTDGARIYFGDAEDDTLLALPKAGSDKVVLARRAPTRGGLVVTEDLIAWIASPGATVLRASKSAPNKPEVLREGGLFAQIAGEGSEVFFTEAIGGGGVVFRSARTTAKLAAFEGAPRGLAVDSSHVYLATPERIARVTRTSGSMETLATGDGFAEVVLDDTGVYALAADTNAKVALRIPKAGGTPRVIARGVAIAPIAVHRGELYWLDATRPALRATTIEGGATRVVSDDAALREVNALRIDDAGIFFATGEGEDAQILVIDQGSHPGSKM